MGFSGPGLGRVDNNCTFGAALALRTLTLSCGSRILPRRNGEYTIYMYSTGADVRSDNDGLKLLQAGQAGITPLPL